MDEVEVLDESPAWLKLCLVYKHGAKHRLTIGL